jgi:3-carboxy-cis,cis-muconate cycloisomerase
MTFSPTDSKIYASLFSDPNLAALFSDEQFVRYLLAVEAALAATQGRLDVIPAEAAGKIVAGVSTLRVDFEALQTGTEQAGLPIIELLRQLRTQVGREVSGYVHWGATTQDIMDTALVLQIRAALEVIEPLLADVIKNLAQLAHQHRDTLMAGRTHSQQRHKQRLMEMKPRLLVVQFGGAVGTLASLGERGVAVQAALADELGLAVPLMPWHTQRDTLAELAGWLSLVSGSLAKMGQDIILMAQTEVGEVRESADLSRGGSSTMPQKSNPIVSELIVAAARTNASLLASMHQALVQEHERATHGWQVEWLNLPQMFALTGAALNKALFLSANLVVNEVGMRENVAASNGLMLGEAVSFALAPHLGRTAAKQMVQTAVPVAIKQNRHLVDVVREQADAPIDWQTLQDESAYLGSAAIFIDRVLAEAEKA